MSYCCSLAFKACRCMSSGHVSTCLGFAGHLESATIEREHTGNIGKLCLHHCKTLKLLEIWKTTGGTTSWTTSWTTSAPSSGPETQGFIPSWWQGRSANLQTPTHSRCAKQTSSNICVVCKCLSQFDFCKPVLPWNARHCFKLYDLFFVLYESASSLDSSTEKRRSCG